MTYDAFRQHGGPIKTLTALIAAGLGDIPQPLIFRSQYEAAMRGEKVQPTLEQRRYAMRGENTPAQRRQYLSPADILGIQGQR